MTFLLRWLFALEIWASKDSNFHAENFRLPLIRWLGLPFQSYPKAPLTSVHTVIDAPKETYKKRYCARGLEKKKCLHSKFIVKAIEFVLILLFHLQPSETWNNWNNELPLVYHSIRIIRLLWPHHDCLQEQCISKRGPTTVQKDWNLKTT